MAQQIHPGDPSYAPPLIRPPSPASSIGTVYGPDEDSYSDTELTDEAFIRKHDALLRLDEPSDSELRAMRSVLLPKPKTAEEEMSMSTSPIFGLNAEKCLTPIPIVIHKHVLANLRKEVRRLEEDELFEQMLHRQDRNVIPEPQSAAASGDIDAIMQSIMPPPQSAPVLPPDVLGFASTLRGHGFGAEETMNQAPREPPGEDKKENKGKARAQ
jgi:hypothetical protein